MHDRRHEEPHHHAHGPGPASLAPGPGKSTRVQELGAPPIASAAAAGGGKDDKPGLLEQLQHKLDAENKKLLGKLVGKVVSTATDEAIKKLLGKLEAEADTTLKNHADPKNVDCPDALTVRLVELAINTKRLLAALRLVQGMSKAVKAELKTLEGKDPIKKLADSVKNLGDAMKALGSYFEAMDKANGQIDLVHEAARKCHARANPNLVPMPDFTRKPDKLPPQITLPPDIDHEKSPIHIVIGNDGLFHIG